jgi:hypothetical protein
MTRSTRNFLTGSAVIVALGLGTGLVAYYNGALPGLARQTGEGDLAYLPSDAAAVGYANVREIMTSDFRQKLRQVLPTGEELDKFKNELGVDIERDIDTVAAAYLGGLPALGQAVVIVRGRFNRDQIESVATRHGGLAEDYRGKRLLVMSEGGAHGQMLDGSQHPAAALAFLEDGVLALGEARAIKRAIDTRESGDDVRKNAELAGLMDEVRGEGNAWFVARVNAMTEHAGVPSEIREHIPAVNVFAVSAHVNGGVRGAVRAEARDDQAAEQLRDVVRGLLATGKLVGGDDPKVTAMLNSLQIIGKGKVVGLTFTAPAELLDVLNGLAAAHHLGSGSGIRK